MDQKPDFEALFHVSPCPYLLLATDLTIIGANAAYLRITASDAEALLGKHVFNAFPVNPADPGSTNVEQVRISIERAIATGLPHNTAFLRYALPRASADGDAFEDRYWSTVHTPVFNENGELTMIAQSTTDVTELYKLDKNGQMPRNADRGAAVATSAETAPLRRIDDFNRVQMQQAMLRILNDERSHLRSLFNQAPGFIAILMGRNFVFEMVNEAYYQVVGHRDILGKPVFEALPEVAGQGFEKLLSGVFDSGQPFVGHGLQMKVQARPGGPLSNIYVDLLYQPLFAPDGSVAGIFVQGHDVTETYEAQLASRAAHQRLQEGMLAARMVVWEWDLASGALHFSDNATTVFGARWEKMDEIWTAVHPDDAAPLARAQQRALDEKSGYQQILRLLRPDNGEIVWLDDRGKVECDAAGRPLAVRGVSIDITERKRAETELARANRTLAEQVQQLERAKAALRTADHRKDQFLAMLAHELRNPLAPISAAAQLLKHAELNPQRIRATSEVVARQVNHMTALVDDLLDVSRATRGLVTLAREPVDMARVVADAIEQVRPLMEARQQHFSLHMAAVSAYVDGDFKRLVQVLANLLNNAAKYTPPGGHIALAMQCDAGQVLLRVADDGIGMAPELLPQVFDLFTQGERSPDRAQGGLGLGLALVKSLVELHGGSVAADSKGPHAGSEFTIRLPCLASGGQWADNAPTQAPPPRTEALRLMVVDDNVDAAQMMGLFLEAIGHHVAVEHDPLQALERAQREAFDVYLLDIGLPGMDGYELARRLRALPHGRRAVMVAISGYGQQNQRGPSPESGFDHYFVKPADPEKVGELLAEL